MVLGQLLSCSQVPPQPLLWGDTAAHCPTAAWGCVFPLQGWEWGPNCSPQGKSSGPLSARWLLGTPGSAS